MLREKPVTGIFYPRDSVRPIRLHDESYDVRLPKGEIDRRHPLEPLRGDTGIVELKANKLIFYDQDRRRLTSVKSSQLPENDQCMHCRLLLALQGQRPAFYEGRLYTLKSRIDAPESRPNPQSTAVIPRRSSLQPGTNEAIIPPKRLVSRRGVVIGLGVLTTLLAGGGTAYLYYWLHNQPSPDNNMGIAAPEGSIIKDKKNITAVVTQDLINSKNLVNPVLILTVQPGTNFAIGFFNYKKKGSDLEKFATMEHLNSLAADPNNFYVVNNKYPEVIIFDPNHPDPNHLNQRDVSALILLQSPLATGNPQYDVRIASYAERNTVVQNLVNSKHISAFLGTDLGNLPVTGGGDPTFANPGNIKFELYLS